MGLVKKSCVKESLQKPFCLNTGLFQSEDCTVNKSLLGACLVAVLMSVVLAGAMRFGAVQAFTVDSISKPLVPEFSVRIAAYPYDVPPETTTTIDEYTGKETTTTKPGYHVENKSIEITIKNQPFTPYTLTEHTGYNHETGERRTYDRNSTVNLYYNIEVKGHFGENWKSVDSGDFTYEGRKSNAQLDSEYTVFTIEADDYPKDTVLDFRVRALTGYYVPYGRSVVIFGYDFFGQESDWSETQTINVNESQMWTPLPETTPTQTPLVTTPTPPAYQEPQQTEQNETITSAAIVVAVIGAGLGLLIYLMKRK
jgi:hypothetical protein